MLLVLDASVAVKWFLPPEDETLTSEALGLLYLHDAGRIQFLVPDLFWAEFANVAWMAIRRKRWSSSDAVRAVTKMLAYRFATIAGRRLVQAAFHIASTHGVAVYDALYVALAQETPCDLITADERLVNALGSRFPVRWLGSFSIT
jgi:hypothetical protein